MLTDAELIDRFDGYVERTKHAFEQCGFAPHHFMVVKPDGVMGIIAADILPIPKEVDEHTAKDMMANFVTQACKEFDAVAVIHVTEAWALKTTETDPDKADAEMAEAASKGIVNHPERTECLMITLETKHTNKSLTFPIIRLSDEDKEPKLGKVMFELTSGGKAELGGRFTGLLPCNASGVTKTWDKKPDDEQSWGDRFKRG